MEINFKQDKLILGGNSCYSQGMHSNKWLIIENLFYCSYGFENSYLAIINNKAKMTHTNKIILTPSGTLRLFLSNQ